MPEIFEEKSAINFGRNDQVINLVIWKNIMDKLILMLNIK
jgi:hypothetical protein